MNKAPSDTRFENEQPVSLRPFSILPRAVSNHKTGILQPRAILSRPTTLLHCRHDYHHHVHYSRSWINRPDFMETQKLPPR